MTGGSDARQQSLRRTLERDRYGLIAQVLVARDRCSETDCPAFRAFADTTQIKTNMRDRVYDATISRYATAWSGGAVAPSPAVATTAPPMPATPGPTGRPISIDFPSAASIPPKPNIMTSEPSSAPTVPAFAAPKPRAATCRGERSSRAAPTGGEETGGRECVRFRAEATPDHADAAAAAAKPLPATTPAPAADADQ